MDYQDKFVAFIDVLGFSGYVKASAEGQPSLADLVACVSEFNRPTDLPALMSGFPPTCPESRYLRQDLAFRITQVSDCVVVSAEVSPAGVINLIKHCWNAVMRLLDRGYLCRGYIARGLVWHEDRPPFVVGPGYLAAEAGEKSVFFYGGDKQSVSTPFVELSQEVARYVAEETDACVREIYSRLVLEGEGVAALFPFKVLNSFSAPQGQPREAALRTAGEHARKLIGRLRVGVLQHVSKGNAEAMAKVNFYLKALDVALADIDRIAEIMSGPAVRIHHRG